MTATPSAITSQLPLAAQEDASLTPLNSLGTEIALPPAPLPTELDIASKPRTLSAVEALEEVKRTLPVGVELHRSYHYVFPLGKKKLHLLVLLLNSPDELDRKLNDWRSEIADRLDPVSILVRKVRGSQGVLNNLRNTFRGSDLITSADLPVLDTTIESLCGKPPSLSTDEMRTPRQRENLTSIPFIAPDGPGTRDIEDLIHAERKPNGSIVWRTAFIDATDYVTPGSQIDRYALRVGTTTYGRNRTVPTLGPELAHNLASFRQGAHRPAWVIEGTLTPLVETTDDDRSSVRYELSYRIRRGTVMNHLSVDPQNIPPLSADSPFSRSLSAAAGAARILRHLRASKSTPIRVDGAGAPLSTVTAELMIESKRILSEYLGSKAPMIYRVHQKPSQAVKLQFHRALNALKIPNSIENFDNPSEFAGILSSLEARRDPASQALLNDLLDTFLLRTLYGVENYGHFGLRLNSYAEFKPRDASAMTNQMQLDAVWAGREPLPYEEVLHRANVLNEKRWRRDERAYKLRFYEMLHNNLSREGSVYVGTVAAISGKRVLVEVPGFSRWGLLKGVDASSTLEVGSPVTATLRGFDLRRARFLFTID